jgi:diguanylate cyclase (GGDEF)-like protein
MRFPRLDDVLEAFGPDARSNADAGGLERELLRASVTRMLPNTILTLVSALALAATFWNVTPVVPVWLGYVAIVLMGRLVCERYIVARLEDPSVNAATIRRLHGLQSFILIATAVLWPPAYWDALPLASWHERYVLLFLLSFIASAIVSALAPKPFTGRIYLSIVLVPMIVRLTMIEGDVGVLVALSMTFYGVLLFTLSNNHAVLVRALLHAAENTRLLAEVETRADEADGLNRDLEERIAERTHELVRLAAQDSLTGIHNRRWISVQIERLISVGIVREFRILFIDIDHFREVNDSFGHAVGDMVLKEIAGRIWEKLPESALFGRWGGDEFIVVLADEDADEAMAGALAADLIESTRTQIEIGALAIRLKARIGLACWPFDGKDVEQIVQAADLAAVEGKKDGRGSWMRYQDELGLRHRRRLMIARELNRPELFDELSVFYQPIVDAISGQTRRVEALLRWFHPTLGPIGPSEFIPIAEENGNIIEIGAWVLREVCHLVAGWPAGGATRVAVNASLREVLVEGWARRVLDTIAAAGCRPELFEIELTETVFDAHNKLRVAKALEELAANGVSIAIDDFGSGYSSLSRLRELPIGAIKIDRCFIAELDERNRAIIEAAVMIARRFAMSVTAEGVESGEQVSILRTLGVDSFQGFYFARPTRNYRPGGILGVVS